MKKILTTAAAVFALVAVSNAQLFIGGNVDFSMDNKTSKVIVVDEDANESIEKIKQDGATMSINFNPKVGFQLNDQMSVGATLILGTSTMKNFDGSKDNDIVFKDISNTIGIAPFFRYSFVEFGDFKVSAEATLPFFIVSGKTENKIGDETITAKTPKIMNIGFNVLPVVSYSISDRIDLEAHINVFQLGITYASKTPDPEGDGIAKDVRENTTSFNLGIRDRVAQSSAINIGMIFKF